MYEILISDKLNQCTDEQLERYAFGLFVSSCYDYGFDFEETPRCTIVRKVANYIAEYMIKDIYPIPHDVLWVKSNDVIKWAAGVLDQTDKIRLAVIKCYGVKVKYELPLMYILGNRQLETSKEVISECEKWIEEM